MVKGNPMEHPLDDGSGRQHHRRHRDCAVAADKLLSVMRNPFGGHEMKKE